MAAAFSTVPSALLQSTNSCNDSILSSDLEFIRTIFIYFSIFWVILEIAFFIIIQFVLLPSLQKLRPPDSRVCKSNAVDFMRRILDCMQDLRGYSIEQYISGFLCNAPFEDICVDNFRSLLAWAMFSKHLKDLSSIELVDMQTVYDMACQKFPQLLKLKAGFNPKLKHVSMTLEPIPVIHRPLLVYVAVHLGEAVVNNLFLRTMYGFQSLELNGITYWYKQHGHRESHDGRGLNDKSSDPVVMFHGITTGWGLYINLIRVLAQNRTVVLIDLEGIKIKSMSFQLPTPEQFANKVHNILKRHKIKRCSIVAHSFGSVSCTWFLRYYPESISHITMIDPVSILLMLPDVAYSFLYRTPSNFFQCIVYFCASRDLTVSHMLHRQFWWYNNIFWLDDLPAHIGLVVGLAGNDQIANAKVLQQYINNFRSQRLRKQRHIRDDCSSLTSMDTVAALVRTTDGKLSSSSAAAGSHDELFMRIRTTNEHLRCIRKPFASSSSSSERYSEVAMVQCVFWDDFIHGQILFPSSAQEALISTMHTNEKLGVNSDCAYCHSCVS